MAYSSVYFSLFVNVSSAQCFLKEVSRLARCHGSEEAPKKIFCLLTSILYRCSSHLIYFSHLVFFRWKKCVVGGYFGRKPAV